MLMVKAEHAFLTVAGQTAPGKGILIRDYRFAMSGGADVVTRFMRVRVGLASGLTQDGMNQTASNNTILDHCSISWTIDEGFSSRQAHNITLQRTLISECLNDADHAIQMSPHGYAASINGDIGSYHRNLLAHCVGRNWSLAGGLKGGSPVTAIGRLDIRNNVVYNWKDRTTDGEIYQVNFVNNYYKKGPASTRDKAIALQFYAIAENLPQYYLAGNVMPGVFTASEVSKSYDFPVTPPGNYLATKQLWEPYVETITAEQAYEDVLNDVGANVPALDDHDKRIINEVRTGTYKYKGSRTGLPGHIDSEADAGGFESFPTVTRPTGWDTDNDGIPNAWETAHGLNPNDASDGNGTKLSKIGYTNLEMYLNELAGDLK
ncbi:MAG: thrombospondin type 3 repeat-containing protein [Polyangiaceae bacterium]